MKNTTDIQETRQTFTTNHRQTNLSGNHLTSLNSKSSQMTSDGSLIEMIEGCGEISGSKAENVERSVTDQLRVSNTVDTSLPNSVSFTARNSLSMNDEERVNVLVGREIDQMSLNEPTVFLQKTTDDLLQNEKYAEVKSLSSVDWRSLNKSCKCAKKSFHVTDHNSQLAVKNMFLENLDALIAQCNLYVAMSDTEDVHDVEKIVQLTTNTKHALRFGMSSLSPPREDETNASELLTNVTGGMKTKNGSDFREEVERCKRVRRFRQELQDAAVKTKVEEGDNSRQGLHFSLVDIILGTKPSLSKGRVPTSIEKDQYTIQILAAKMLCNIVTDNRVTAEIVLIDCPFGPSDEESEHRMSLPHDGDPLKNMDIVLCWSDLVTATAKLGNSTDPEREALAAVAATLHNLLASLETRDSLIELDNELKCREQLKSNRARALMSRRSTSFLNNNTDDDHSTSKPLDAGVDAAYIRQLMNALLRNILPAHAVIMESRSASVGSSTFQTSNEAHDQSQSFGDTSDSATEWISLIIERLTSRGLLPQMFESVGGNEGKSVTPEQVVLISCIQQAVDDYHCACTSTEENGEFEGSRLLIAAKSTGVATLSRPHPLWGRIYEEFGEGRVSPAATKIVNEKDRRQGIPNTSVVQNLLFLANQVDRMYLRSETLNSNPSKVLYDGELSCTLRVIEDIRDIIGQCLGRHNTNPSQKNKECILSEARSVLGKETSVIIHCMYDLADLVDSALARNIGKNARDLHLTPQEQHSAIAMVRLIGNIVYQCRYNQDILRIIPIPISKQINATNTEQRLGLHVILSATSLAPTCLSLREWCIVAIRNAVENNEANEETIRRLEAQNTLGETPELRRMGMKVNMDARGNVRVEKRGGLN